MESALRNRHIDLTTGDGVGMSLTYEDGTNLFLINLFKSYQLLQGSTTPLFISSNMRFVALDMLDLEKHVARSLYVGVREVTRVLMARKESILFMPLDLGLQAFPTSMSSFPTIACKSNLEETKEI
ncbi:hypothetical protein CR513_40219, partial [Mucuna pruriens]